MSNLENGKFPPAIYSMMAAAGVSAASLHYAQPLLPSIASSLGVSQAAVGAIPALIQVGFALSIFFVLPLSDLAERRRLVMILQGILALALLGVALAPNLPTLVFAAFVVGISGVVAQMFAPFVSLLVPRERAGAALGIVLSGVLGGVLLSKVVAGLASEVVGWRIVFGIASFAMLILVFISGRLLPRSKPDTAELNYGLLLSSVVRLVIGHRHLQRHMLSGALTFWCFMSLWTTYASYLFTRFGLGPGAAGLIALGGLVGAASAGFAGRAVDRGGYGRVMVLAGVLMAGGFIWLGISGGSLWLFLVGVLLVDAGAGLSHAANQSSAFALDPQAGGRLNSAYMLAYFTGGALGTVVSSVLLFQFGWWAVCLQGGLIALAVALFELRRPLQMVRD